MIAQTLPAFKFLYELILYLPGLALYNLKSLFDNTIEIIPSVRPGNP